MALSLNKVVPGVSLTFVGVNALAFVLYGEDKTGTPKYARLGLLSCTLLDMCGSMVHWLLKPMGGLERVAMIDLGADTAVKWYLGKVQAQEGLQRVVKCLVYLYVFFREQGHTFKALSLIFLHQIAEIWTLFYYKRNGLKNLFKKGRHINAPGQARWTIFLMLSGIPIFRGLLNGDYAKNI